jgi:3-oxoacyl-[acyl-carrier protein] reductase
MSERDRDFPDGCAMIFGGSGGIGRGVALQFAQAGTAVAIGYRSNQSAAEAAAEAVRACGVDVSIHQLDVRDRSQIERAVTDAAATHGRVHSMVWAAGPLVPQLYISKWTAEHYRNALEVEALGFFAASQVLIEHFRAKGGGAIVHLGSAGHDLWPAKDGLSVAPKAANEALMRGIAREEGRNEIRANSVLIGVIDAGMFHQLSEQGAFGEEWVQQTQRLLALKRWGKAADIGDAAVFLCSNRASYVTGQTISVSGGFGI